MSKNEKIKPFFELLCLNDSKEIRKYLMNHGKGPKPVCPIMFIDKESEEEKDGNK